jgi:hypothetical protein
VKRSVSRMPWLQVRAKEEEEEEEEEEDSMR